MAFDPGACVPGRGRRRGASGARLDSAHTRDPRPAGPRLRVPHLWDVRMPEPGGGAEGTAGCVLIRALEPVNGLARRGGLRIWPTGRANLHERWESRWPT